MTSHNLLTPRQAAEKIGISYPAMKHWILAGRIRTVKTPIGHSIYCGFDSDSPKPMRIVGVVGDIRQLGPATPPWPLSRPLKS